MAYVFNDIQISPGVQPITDFTNQSTSHWTAADKIRFVDGFPEKIGGWTVFTLESGQAVSGCPRTIFSYILDGKVFYSIGTHTRLYSLLSSQLTNITPLVTATTAIANSLDTHFGLLGNDPIDTVNTSTTLTINDTATVVRVGDTITLSGSAAVNGVPAVEINAAHLVRTQSTNSYTIIVATAATSTGSGGGAVVNQATGIITVNQTAHGFADGDRVKILAAAATGGITAAQINIEHIIRNTATNAYDISTAGTATSSVTGGGGASTTVQGQIAAGECDATTAQGYGAGRYGVGLYGVSKSSSSAGIPPRIWSFDRFGDLVIQTPGVQTGLYSWDSVTSVAPVLVTNAPTAINYCFTSNNIAVTLGAGGIGNRIQWSDQGNLTTWTATAENQAGQDDIEGADDFISHLNLRGFNLLFTENQVYTFRYIRKPFVWETKLLDAGRGLIAQNARISVDGVAYWMGLDNFYQYRGGNVEITPSNTTPETTLKKFVFDNLNFAQRQKIFCFYNEKFHEIWWHYPSSGSNEPDRIVRFNIKDFTWTPDTLDRSAAEYPNVLSDFPRLIDIDGVIYDHESGDDDDAASLAFSLTGPFFNSGTDTIEIGGIIPDSIQSTGNITVSVNVKRYPQSTSSTKGPFTITPTTELITPRISARFWQYVIAGDVLGQSWRAGRWQERIQGGTNR
ncbi:MAG: hypothetical protein V3T88_06245 [Nitrosomonadaceae bacterium]